MAKDVLNIAENCSKCLKRVATTDTSSLSSNLGSKTGSKFMECPYLDHLQRHQSVINSSLLWPKGIRTLHMLGLLATTGWHDTLKISTVVLGIRPPVIYSWGTKDFNLWADSSKLLRRCGGGTPDRHSLSHATNRANWMIKQSNGQTNVKVWESASIELGFDWPLAYMHTVDIIIDPPEWQFSVCYCLLFRHNLDQIVLRRTKIDKTLRLAQM